MIQIGDSVIITANEPGNYIGKGSYGTVIENQENRTHTGRLQIKYLQVFSEKGEKLDMNENDALNYIYYTHSRRVKLKNKNWRKRLE